jgi:hypothetical protein
MMKRTSLPMTVLSEGNEECEHLLIQIEKMMMTPSRWTDRQRLGLAFVCVEIGHETSWQCQGPAFGPAQRPWVAQDHSELSHTGSSLHCFSYKSALSVSQQPSNKTSPTSSLVVTENHCSNAFTALSLNCGSTHHSVWPRILTSKVAFLTSQLCSVFPSSIHMSNATKTMPPKSISCHGWHRGQMSFTMAPLPPAALTTALSLPKPSHSSPPHKPASQSTTKPSLDTLHNDSNKQLTAHDSAKINGKERLVLHTLRSINCDVPGKAFATLENSANVFIIKFAQDHLPAHRHMHLHTLGQTPCRQSHPAHSCSHSNAKNRRHPFQPTLLDGSQQSRTCVLCALQLQNKIGWQHLLKGRFPWSALPHNMQFFLGGGKKVSTWWWALFSRATLTLLPPAHSFHSNLCQKVSLRQQRQQQRSRQQKLS